MTKETLFKESYAWASKYSQELKEMIEQDKEYYMSILNIERESVKPRKDITTYKDILPYIWYMYDEVFEQEKTYEFMKITDREEIKKITETYMHTYFSVEDDKDTWFTKIKSLCEALGYASNMKEYKQNPEAFKGNITDVSTVLRVALTKKAQTPDLYEIMHILGRDKMIERFEKLSCS